MPPESTHRACHADTLARIVHRTETGRCRSCALILASGARQRPSCRLLRSSQANARHRAVTPNLHAARYRGRLTYPLDRSVLSAPRHCGLPERFAYQRVQLLGDAQLSQVLADPATKGLEAHLGQPPGGHCLLRLTRQVNDLRVQVTGCVIGRPLRYPGTER